MVEHLAIVTAKLTTSVHNGTNHNFFYFSLYDFFSIGKGLYKKIHALRIFYQ